MSDLLFPDARDPMRGLIPATEPRLSADRLLVEIWFYLSQNVPIPLAWALEHEHAVPGAWAHANLPQTMVGIAARTMPLRALGRALAAIAETVTVHHVDREFQQRMIDAVRAWADGASSLEALGKVEQAVLSDHGVSSLTRMMARSLAEWPNGEPSFRSSMDLACVASDLVWNTNTYLRSIVGPTPDTTKSEILQAVVDLTSVADVVRSYLPTLTLADLMQAPMEIG